MSPEISEHAFDGTAQCWGRNEAGQLGDGTFADRLTPTAVVW